MTIREKLHKLIQVEIPWIEIRIDALRVNRGASKFNDWCSWTANGKYSDGPHMGMCVTISSYSTMSDLVKSGFEFDDYMNPLSTIGKKPTKEDYISGFELNPK